MDFIGTIFFRIHQKDSDMDDELQQNRSHHGYTHQPLFTRPNATFSERFAVGFTYCFASAIFLFLQFSILTIFFTYKDYYMNMCYRIMIVISIVDSVQLFVHFYGGLIAIFNSSFNYWLEKLMGGLLNSFCIALFPLCLVLALERLLVYLPRIFSNRTEAKLVGLMIGLCFIWATPFFIAYLTPYSGIIFRSYAWDYDDSAASKWQFVQNIDESSSMPILAVTFVIYLFILGILIYKRRFNESRNSQASSMLIAPHEKRLLIQSLIQFWLELSLNMLWLFQAFSVIPDFPLNEAAINFYWILFNGIKPILYLIFNTPIRERTIRLWRCEGKEKLQLSSNPIAELILQAPRTSIPSSRVAPITMNGGNCRAETAMDTSIRPPLRMDKEIRFQNGQLQIVESSKDGGSITSRSSNQQHNNNINNMHRPSLPHFSFRSHQST